jgi:hypothetical protein
VGGQDFRKVQLVLAGLQPPEKFYLVFHLVRQPDVPQVDQTIQITSPDMTIRWESAGLIWSFRRAGRDTCLLQKRSRGSGNQHMGEIVV